MWPNRLVETNHFLLGGVILEVPKPLGSSPRPQRPQRVRAKYTHCNHLGGGLVVKAWDQEVCSLCGLRFEPCGCSYDGH
jgi:hypothetical protein